MIGLSKFGQNNLMKKGIEVFALILLVLFSGCSEVNTTDPQKIYQYWSGTKPPKEIILIHGQYWQSAHWSKEYIMFLQYEATENWWAEFVQINSMVITKEKTSPSEDAPEWFKPSKNAIVYKSAGEFDQGSRYFWEPDKKMVFAYEIQH